MTKTFDLTEKEFKAARIFVASCLISIGGKRPSDLADDEYTWIELTDLTDAGYSKHEAAGLMSALDAKGFIMDYDPTEKHAAHWIVTTAGWQWMDTVWEATNV